MPDDDQRRHPSHYSDDDDVRRLLVAERNRLADRRAALKRCIRRLVAELGAVEQHIDRVDDAID